MGSPGRRVLSVRRVLRGARATTERPVSGSLVLPALRARPVRRGLRAGRVRPVRRASKGPRESVARLGRRARRGTACSRSAAILMRWCVAETVLRMVVVRGSRRCLRRRWIRSGGSTCSGGCVPPLSALRGGRRGLPSCVRVSVAARRLSLSAISLALAGCGPVRRDAPVRGRSAFQGVGVPELREFVRPVT